MSTRKLESVAYQFEGGFSVIFEPHSLVGSPWIVTIWKRETGNTVISSRDLIAGFTDKGPPSWSLALVSLETCLDSRKKLEKKESSKKG